MVSIRASGLLCAALIFGIVVPARAQEVVDTVRVIKVGDTYRPIDDTTMIYHPGAVVLGARPHRIRSANTYQRISLAGISRLDVASVAQLGRLIPAGHVQTNSRGEALLNLRNAGERQVALFFDGALLNIPWDYRVDLDMIPAGAVGSMTVSKGNASAAFGPNVMGGAVNLMSRSPTSTGTVTEVDLQAGNAGFWQGTALNAGNTKSFQWVASAGYTTRDGFPLSSDAMLPYSQEDPNVRTNTDLTRFNVFARGAYKLESGMTLALTGSVVDAEKGIAPEGHKNPDETGSIRYWRYPDWRSVLAIASVGTETSSTRRTGFRASAWVNSFQQRIVSYEDVSYEAVEATQDDDDVTVGGRFALTQPIDASELRLSINGTYTSHDLAETDDTGLIEQTFEQLLLGAGAEADIRPGGQVWYTGSLNLDMQSIPEADVFSTVDPDLEVNGMAGAVYQLNALWAFRGSVGRKSRFPTMRERYDGALGRFVVNPDLKSESAFLSEVGASFISESTELELVAFADLTSNTIDQSVIEVDGDTKRIRVNLEGSRNYGVELSGSGRPARGAIVQINAMYSHLRGFDDVTNSYDRPLTERPEILATASGTYNHPAGYNGTVEVVYTGKAYSLADTGRLVPLSTSTVVNLRAGYRLVIGAGESNMEVFGRVNNVGDVLVDQQLGLPGPGRSMIAGFKLGV